MKGRSLIGVLAVCAAVVVAWSIQKNSETRRFAEQTPAIELQEEAMPEAMAEAAPQSSSDARRPEQQNVGDPLSDQKIAEFHRRINELASDYRSRIEARRMLLAALLDRGPSERVEPELLGLLEDVERSEGEVMARRVAFAEANTWQANKHFASAVTAYRLLIDRWPESEFAVEALLHEGDCQLELRAYEQAESTFRNFVEMHNDSSMAGWGWRKLALVQLLRSDFDRSLATLDLMAAKFKVGEFAEYARARKGYVLMVAGKMESARTAYEAFLAECPSSRYCRLVKRQMEELENWKTLARAGD